MNGRTARWSTALGVVLCLVGAAPAPAGLDDVDRLIDAGRYAEAESMARELLKGVAATSGEDSPEAAEILDRLVEARWRVGRATEPETRELAQRAVELKARHLGDEHAGVAASLRNLGIVLEYAGDYEGASVRYERALEIRRRAHGDRHAAVADSLVDLGILHFSLGDYETAKPFYEEALAIRESVLGPEHPAVARVLTNLANLLKVTGEYDEAKPLYERCIRILETHYSGGHPHLANAVNSLGTLMMETGEFERARALYRRALSMWEELLGPDHPNLASPLYNLGNLLFTTGEFDAARPLFERALELWEAAGPDNPQAALSLNSMALLHHKTGDFEQARQHYERALDLVTRAHGPDHPTVFDSSNNLANLLSDMGDLERARQVYENLLSVTERRFGPDHVDVALVLDNLAVLLSNLQRHADARRMHERALAILESQLGADHPAVATTLGNLGQLHLVAGETVEARRLLQRALEIQQRRLGREHPVVADTLNSLAVLAGAAGRHEETAELTRRAIAILERAYGPEHPSLAKALITLAESRSRLGDSSGALEAALRAEIISREHLRLTARTLSERLALEYATTRTSGLDLALRTVDGRSTLDARRAVWNELIRSRALVLDEMAARRRRIVSSPEVSALEGALNRSRQRLANLMVRGPGDESIESFRRLLDDARTERDAAERALAVKSADFRSEQRGQRVGLAEVAAALPKDGVLVGYTRYADSYLAFVLREASGECVAVPLGGARAIESAVSRWKAELSGGVLRPGRTAREAEAAYRRAGAELRKLVVDPLLAHLEGARQVFVVPDSALHAVSLAALPLGESGFLVEADRPIHYLSAERELVRLDDSQPHGSGLLALGAADYGRPRGTNERQTGPEECVDLASLDFESLPSSREEIREIVDLWSRSPSSPPAEALQLTGTGASEAAFKEAVRGKRILHVSTHGFFLNGDCVTSTPGLRGVGGLVESDDDDVMASAPRSNPLLLSGLAFAGANTRRSGATQDEIDDGILTSEEIATLDLSGVEWVVLSACETGVGRIAAGEGVLGLRRAFRNAGARTLIMSLWSVEDESARRWMRALYEARLSRGVATADAVRQASLEVLRRRREDGESTHPFYWAAFVAVGDWQ